MYVKIEDIVGNIKTKKYSGILIIFVNTIKPSEMTAFQIWSAKPRRISPRLITFKISHNRQWWRFRGCSLREHREQFSPYRAM